MIGQTDRQRWRAWRVTLAEAFMGHHKAGEADHKPESSPVAGLAPGQTAGSAPQGATSRRHVPYHRSIQAIWLVVPSCRTRHCVPQRRGPPNTTRLLPATTRPVG